MNSVVQPRNSSLTHYGSVCTCCWYGGYVDGDYRPMAMPSTALPYEGH